MAATNPKPVMPPPKPVSETTIVPPGTILPGPPADYAAAKDDDEEHADLAVARKLPEPRFPVTAKRPGAVPSKVEVPYIDYVAGCPQCPSRRVVGISGLGPAGLFLTLTHQGKKLPVIQLLCCENRHVFWDVKP